MKTPLHRTRTRLLLLVPAIAMAAWTGCRQTDSSDPAPDTVNDNAAPPAPEAPAPIALRSGTVRVTGLGTSQVDAGAMSAAGNLIAMATWQGGGTVSASLQPAGAPAPLATRQGESPLTLSADVTAGTRIGLLLSNDDSADKMVRYSLTLDPR